MDRRAVWAAVYRITELEVTDVTLVCTHAYGTPLQCSCLENPMDGGAWWAAVHGVA